MSPRVPASRGTGQDKTLRFVLCPPGCPCAAKRAGDRKCKPLQKRTSCEFGSGYRLQFDWSSCRHGLPCLQVRRCRRGAGCEPAAKRLAVFTHCCGYRLLGQARLLLGARPAPKATGALDRTEGAPMKRTTNRDLADVVGVVLNHLDRLPMVKDDAQLRQDAFAFFRKLQAELRNSTITLQLCVKNGRLSCLVDGHPIRYRGDGLVLIWLVFAGIQTRQPPIHLEWLPAKRDQTTCFLQSRNRVVAALERHHRDVATAARCISVSRGELILADRPPVAVRCTLSDDLLPLFRGCGVGEQRSGS